MFDWKYERLLGVKTVGEQEQFYDSFLYHRYEPTPYYYLEKLIQEHTFTSRDHLVDFGCGKGRLNFFLHHETGASVTGVEMNEEFYQNAMTNLHLYEQKYGNTKGKVSFFCGLAEDYSIHEKNNRFYFFNPFSIHIFRNIIHRILQSVEQSPRKVEVILYYPSEDYVAYLEGMGLFILKKEIICDEKDPYERFLVYGLIY